MSATTAHSRCALASLPVLHSDATALLSAVAAMMPANEPVHQHASRGLDHGAWVPLKIMYPEADIPVLQMSLPTQDPTRLLALGERLRPLRDEGVLIVGSGFLTHGLPFLTEFRIDAAGRGWSTEFDARAGEAQRLGGALEALGALPFGRPAMAAIAGGLIAFGAYALFEARFRPIRLDGAVGPARA